MPTRPKQPRLVLAGEILPEPKRAPVPVVTLDVFREQWRALVHAGKVFHKVCAELVELVESTPDKDPPMLDRPDFLAKFDSLDRQRLQTFYQAQQREHQAVALALGLSAEDRVRVEQGVGPLFHDDGAKVVETWRAAWLKDEDRMISRASTYHRLLSNRPGWRARGRSNS